MGRGHCCPANADGARVSASSAAPAGDRAELIACLTRISRGENAALEKLYHRTSAKLFGVCLRILTDRAEAEDVLQEVYLTVWNKAAQFDAERGPSPITWLVSIARNRALDRLRAKKQRFGGLDEAAEIADLSPLADAALAARETSERLAACLQQLDDRAATAIRSAFFGGQTYDLLARAAEIPLGSMKSLIRRGLMRLKDCLGS
jgi:RNA polymerase sigma-70 factor (ECF subfamily)